MRFCLPASLGMVVPSRAMSKRSPPCLGSCSDGAIFSILFFFLLFLGRRGLIWGGIFDVGFFLIKGKG